MPSGSRGHVRHGNAQATRHVGRIFRIVDIPNLCGSSPMVFGMHLDSLDYSPPSWHIVAVMAADLRPEMVIRDRVNAELFDHRDKIASEYNVVM